MPPLRAAIIAVFTLKEVLVSRPAWAMAGGCMSINNSSLGAEPANASLTGFTVAVVVPVAVVAGVVPVVVVVAGVVPVVVVVTGVVPVAVVVPDAAVDVLPVILLKRALAEPKKPPEAVAVPAVAVPAAAPVADLHTARSLQIVFAHMVASHGLAAPFRALPTSSDFPAAPAAFPKKMPVSKKESLIIIPMIINVINIVMPPTAGYA
jgi:hypothetical protein